MALGWSSDRVLSSSTGIVVRQSLIIFHLTKMFICSFSIIIPAMRLALDWARWEHISLTRLKPKLLNHQSKVMDRTLTSDQILSLWAVYTSEGSFFKNEVWCIKRGENREKLGRTSQNIGRVFGYWGFRGIWPNSTIKPCKPPPHLLHCSHRCIKHLFSLATFDTKFKQMPI